MGKKRKIPVLVIILSSCLLQAQDIKFTDSGVIARLEKYYYYYVSQKVVDWNSDNKNDIIVGFITDPIKMQCVENVGTADAPVFKNPVSIPIPSS